MMRLLSYLFLAMAAFGFYIGHVGGALIALAMWGLLHYAKGVFAAQDAAYNAHPDRASPLQAPTSDALARAESECVADKL